MRQVLSIILFVFSPLVAAADSWQSTKLPEDVAKGPLRCVCFTDANTGWAVGDKGLCITTADGGKNWKPVATNSGAILRDVRFKDAQHGWICGDNDENAPQV